MAMSYESRCNVSNASHHRRSGEESEQAGRFIPSNRVLPNYVRRRNERNAEDKSPRQWYNQCVKFYQLLDKFVYEKFLFIPTLYEDQPSLTSWIYMEIARIRQETTQMIQETTQMIQETTQMSQKTALMRQETARMRQLLWQEMALIRLLSEQEMTIRIHEMVQLLSDPQHNNKHDPASKLRFTDALRIGIPLHHSTKSRRELPLDHERTKVTPAQVQTSRQAFDYDNTVRGQLVPTILHAAQEKSHPSPPDKAELSNLADDNSKLWGRKRLAAWRETSGLSKEWRLSRYIKATNKHLREFTYATKNWPSEAKWKRSSSIVPISVLRRERSLKLRYFTRSRKASSSENPAVLRHLTNEALQLHHDRNMDDDRVKHSFEASKLPSYSSLDSTNTQPQKRLLTSFPLDLVIPYENFIGAVFRLSFRVVRFLRSENSGNVYAVEDLSPTSNRYEAKAYTLRGIPEKVRKYRVVNLKRLSQKPSFVCSFDQDGKKFVVNRLGAEKQRCVSGPLSSKGSEIQASKLGAIGRRNTREFEQAFPMLPKPSRLICALSSPPKPPAVGRASAPVQVTGSKQSEQEKEGMSVKPKTWRQMERRRVRQWRSRRTKNAWKKAGDREENATTV